MRLFPRKGDADIGGDVRHEVVDEELQPDKHVLADHHDDELLEAAQLREEPIKHVRGVREHLVKHARTGVMRTGLGGFTGAARGLQLAEAALRTVYGRHTPLGEPGWATGRRPHWGSAPLPTSCARTKRLEFWPRYNSSNIIV